jgi:hypothetical protein
MARSGDDVAAGDGLGAFGAALILPVQTYSKASRATAQQWIYEKQRHALTPLQAINGRPMFSLK